MKIRVGSVIGWICASLVAALTLFSGVMEFIMPMNDPSVIEFVTKLGLGGLEYHLGVAKLVIAVLFLIPRTSTVGFVLMIGYYGGALATHITHQQTFAEYGIICVVLALLTVSAYFRNPELLSRVKGKSVA